MSNKIDIELFEKVFCYNVMFDISYANSVIDHYNKQYFENKNISLVLDKVFNFVKDRNAIPNTTELKLLFITNEDKTALVTTLKEINEIDKTYNQEELYINTETFLREKAVFNSLLTVADDIKHGNVDTTKILEQFTESCSISLIDDLGYDYLNKIDHHCEELLKPNNTIPTGWKWLDNLIGGGWQSDGKALYVFTGFTNVGKSIFLQHTAMAGLKANKNVLLISLEMSEQMYARRISSNISKIAYNNLPQYINDLKTSVIDFKNSISGKLILKEFPTKTMTVSHFNSYINKLTTKGFKPDMIVLDYLNLVKSGKVHNGTYDEIKHIAEQLRASTYLFGIPIITASQLGRSAANKEEPGMDKISESIGLSFTADAQFSIWSSEEDKKYGITHMGIQKNRFGPAFGVTNLKVIYETLTLEELPDNVLITNNDTNNVEDSINDLITKKLL